MFLDEPLRVVILYGDRRGALKALFAIEEVKAVGRPAPSVDLCR
jgi:hypothetical protein